MTIHQGGRASTDEPTPQARPVVIAHRGACGYRPEHTIASYQLAAQMGADFIEADLVTTRDHVLVARHEPELSRTTDIAARHEFAGRKTTKLVDGVVNTGWFVEDFTLAELTTLRSVERMPMLRQYNTLYNGRFRVPTLDEILDLRTRLSRELGRRLGVFLELKHPTYFADRGLPLEDALTRTLIRRGLAGADAPVVVESFEASSLRRLHDEHRLRVRKVLVTEATGGPVGDERTYSSYLTPAGLRELSTFCEGIGPDKNQVIPRDDEGRLGTPTTLVTDAHGAGLAVYPYSFREENQFLPVDLRIGSAADGYGRAVDEQLAFLCAGVDGVFTDQPDISVLARHRFGIFGGAGRLAGRRLVTR